MNKSLLQGDGPYKGTWNPNSPLRIALTEHRRVGEAEDDVSPSGCRDMAGNGREWTRSLFGLRQTLPLAEPMQTVNVLLRGKGLAGAKDAQPLTYQDLQDDVVGNVPMNNEPQNDLGFRVVLELEP